MRPDHGQLALIHGLTCRWVHHRHLTAGTPIVTDPDTSPNTRPVQAVTSRVAPRARTRIVPAVVIDDVVYTAEDMPGAWVPHGLHLPMLITAADHPSSRIPFAVHDHGTLTLRFTAGRFFVSITRTGPLIAEAWAGVTYDGARAGIWHYADDADLAGMLALNTVYRLAEPRPETLSPR